MAPVVAIDPGRTGYIVAADSDGVCWSEPMPGSPQGLCDLLRERCLDLTVYVEEQSMRAKQAHQSLILTNYGRILGMLVALGIRHEVVPPKDWQRAMLRGVEKGTKGDALKRAYTEVAERLFPRTGFRGPRGGLLDGKAAAALIAEHGRRRLLGVAA